MRIFIYIAAALWCSLTSATEFKPDATQQLTLATALPLSAEMQQLQQATKTAVESWRAYRATKLTPLSKVYLTTPGS